MCGIYGVLGLNGPARTGVDVIGRMGDLMVHRGPDDSGIYADEQVRLGMRRLSIIDVSGGHQPIKNEAGDIVVVCNGEIYNFRALRAELVRKGHHFGSHSDTEVLVHLYEEEGEKFLGRLEGMFALALWDRPNRKLIVARDALGIKPLYFGEVAGELVFASEAKSLLALPGFRCELDPVSLGGFLGFGYVAAPRSMFRGIQKLEPGQALVVEHGRSRMHKFWSLPADVDTTVSEADWVERIRTEVERSVHDQMVSDVPIGAFLSGGIDSSAIVACMSRHSPHPVRTYSIGFKGSSGAELYNELPHAQAVAQAFGTQHREILVQPDVVSLLPLLAWHLDEPIADAAFITTYLVAKFAREDVTVILSGVGGDELFGGYRRYLDGHLRSRYRSVPQIIRRGLIEPLAKRLPSDRHHRLLNELRLARAFVLADHLPFPERYSQFMQVFSAAERATLLLGGGKEQLDYIAQAFANTRSRDQLRQLMDVDLATQLPEDLLMLTDKMTMATSLECRVPLLDQGLVALAARIPAPLRMKNGELKYLLKRALIGQLPDEILYRKKRGFGAPVGAWFKQELARLVDHVLSASAVRKRGLLNPDVVTATIAEHRASGADRTDHLLGLLGLEIWCRLYLDRVSPDDLASELQDCLRA